NRKRDPGEIFPWPRLAAAGVGLWIAPEPIVTGGALCPGDQGERVVHLQRLLAAFRYGVVPSGHYDSPTHQVVAAFPPPHRPARVDGIADVATVRTLEKVVIAKEGTRA